MSRRSGYAGNFLIHRRAVRLVIHGRNRTRLRQTPPLKPIEGHVHSVLRWLPGRGSRRNVSGGFESRLILSAFGLVDVPGSNPGPRPGFVGSLETVYHELLVHVFCMHAKRADP